MNSYRETIDSMLKNEQINRLENENAILKARLRKNGYEQIWHRCSSGGVKPYSQVCCSMCLPSDEVRDFNPFDEYVPQITNGETGFTVKLKAVMFGCYNSRIVDIVAGLLYGDQTEVVEL